MTLEQYINKLIMKHKAKKYTKEEVKKLLKEQRKICRKAMYDTIVCDKDEYDKILNAPEPDYD